MKAAQPFTLIKGTIGAATPQAEATALKIVGQLILEDGSNVQYTNNNGYLGTIDVVGDASKGTSAGLTIGGKVNLTLDPEVVYKTSDHFTNVNNFVTVGGSNGNLNYAQEDGAAVYKTGLMTAIYNTAELHKQSRTICASMSRIYIPGELCAIAGPATLLLRKAELKWYTY